LQNNTIGDISIALMSKVMPQYYENQSVMSTSYINVANPDLTKHHYLILVNYIYPGSNVERWFARGCEPEDRSIEADEENIPKEYNNLIAAELLLPKRWCTGTCYWMSRLP